MRPEEMPNSPEIKWNPKARLFLADVDDTIAKVYTPATPGMVRELSGLLGEGKVLFMITGGGLQILMQRVVEQIDQPLRRNILISPCSGAEVWGFEPNGHLRTEPYYSVYNRLTTEQKSHWRDLVKGLVRDYDLKTVDFMPIAEFNQQYRGQPRTCMLVDKGPQITLEMINSYDLDEATARDLGVFEPDEFGKYDFRRLLKAEAERRIAIAELPLKMGLGGDFALDFLIKGVVKGDALSFVLENEYILHEVNLTGADLHDPEKVELWGDKFAYQGGDWQMYLGLPENIRKQARAIDFRKSETTGQPEGFNIVLWDGQREFSEGLEEYLEQRGN